MHTTLIFIVLAAFATTSMAAPAPFPVADPKPQSWYGSGYNPPPPPSSSWFPSAAAPPKPAGLTLTGTSGSTFFGSDGSFALSSANSPYGVSYTPGKPAPPAKGFGPWKLNVATGKDSEEAQAVEDGKTVEGESSALPEKMAE
ncbi:hypothetical protein BLS_003886 [Venturia inaequalis]|uniref:Uncharacterized protein n=1 Tax=Venturia inaequalis TaxID=5025 RepID=A0A8H3UMH7_VENIN|nr:hypothetical protein BLS_003886 [Venturia inaequalis]KAE9985136.1 hypothetical protein EG327_004804 [Venturia inaequalis]RDI86003.1 putative drug/proton antiporter [Venturia inaequalis]